MSKMSNKALGKIGRVIKSVEVDELKSGKVAVLAPGKISAAIGAAARELETASIEKNN